MLKIVMLQKKRTASFAIAAGEVPSDAHPVRITLAAGDQRGNRAGWRFWEHPAAVHAPGRDGQFLRLGEERGTLSSRRITVQHQRLTPEAVALLQFRDCGRKDGTCAGRRIPVFAARERGRDEERAFAVGKTSETM